MCVWEMHIFIFLCISVQFMHSRLCASGEVLLSLRAAVQKHSAAQKVGEGGKETEKG